MQDGVSWRPLLGKGCYRPAADLLGRYLAANRSRMTAEQVREIHFHIGQTLAFGGMDAESLPHFESATDAEAPAEWRAYVAATLAFLRKDEAALSRARNDYAAARGASQMRVGIIEALSRCLAQPYAEAIGCMSGHGD